MPKTKPLERGEDPVTAADEEAARASVAEQRVPVPASLPSVKTFRSGAFARLLASRSADGAEVHAAIEKTRGEIDERIGRELRPLGAMIDARFDVQDAKIDSLTATATVQNAKIDSLTGTVTEHGARLDNLTATVTEHSAKIDSLTATVTEHSAKIDGLTATVTEHGEKIDSLAEAIAATNARLEAQNAKLEALKWMFGIIIALLAVLAAAGAFNFLFPQPGAATANSSSSAPPAAIAAEPSNPPAKATASGQPTTPAETSGPIQDERPPVGQTEH